MRAETYCLFQSCCFGPSSEPVGPWGREGLSTEWLSSLHDKFRCCGEADLMVSNLCREKLRSEVRIDWRELRCAQAPAPMCMSLHPDAYFPNRALRIRPAAVGSRLPRIVFNHRELVTRLRRASSSNFLPLVLPKIGEFIVQNLSAHTPPHVQLHLLWNLDPDYAKGTLKNAALDVL